MAWQHWSGRDVARFVEHVCQLPQYGAAMAQINGSVLQELSSKGMLQKGLTRAGVRDADHQTVIAKAVSDLEHWTPEEVSQWYKEHCLLPPAIPVAPKTPRPLRMTPRQKFYAKITGPMTPRTKTSTEQGLQRSSKVPGHFSEERFTPRVYEKTYDFPSRGFGDVKLQDLDEDVVIPPLKLRKQLARSVLDYEAMRDSDSPPVGVAVRGLRGLQSLKEEEENAATRIQASFRQKQAKKEVAKKQQEKEEEGAAAAKIQARYRGKKAAKEVQEMKEQKGAATAIQARYRQRAAQREVEAKRKEKQETDQAATRIQSRFRQRQAAGEVETMRQRRQNTDRDRRREEFKKNFAVKIEISKDPESSNAFVNILVVPREVVDIPMTQETADAATKIQARFRQKQAASEVDAMRKGKDGQSAPADAQTEEVDIPDNEETALAATKIQARFRQKQAASEVESLKKEKEETAQAATKIQAKFRQKQAKNEVDALRAKAASPSEDAAPAPPVDVAEADDEIKAEDMKTTSEFGEVEAMLAQKQKQQQDLVGDKSPKVEGMVPTAVEKRPMSVSPAIMEGDEEE